MHIELTSQAGRTQMQLVGRFDFSTQKQFLAEADQAIARAQATKIEIDLSGIDYIDSAALGMLLMMRDMAKRRDKTVALTGMRGHVKQTIETAQFDRLFAMH